MANKDSYWFRHDSSAGRGTKMRKMKHIYGHFSNGIYWDVCEVLREQDGYKYEYDNSSLSLLCELIGCKDEILFNNWFNDAIKIGLIEKSGKYFFSPALTESMVKWEVKKKNGSLGGRGNKAKKNLKESEQITESKANEKQVTEQTEQNNNNFMKLAMADQIWKEQICISQKDKINIQTFEKRISDFMVQLSIDKKIHISIDEFRKHFANWLRKQEPFRGGSKLQTTI